jgi:hypothetical protein
MARVKMNVTEDKVYQLEIIVEGGLMVDARLIGDHADDPIADVIRRKLARDPIGSLMEWDEARAARLGLESPHAEAERARTPAGAAA